MSGLANSAPRKILIASANPLFSKGLRKLFANRWKSAEPEMRLVSSMDETLSAMKDWLPDLVVVDYDDRAINRTEFLNHFVTGSSPMQVMLVSLQASGEAVVYDRRTLTPAQAESWFQTGSDEETPALAGVDQPNSTERSLQAAAARRPGLSLKWILLTVLVIIITAVFIRLGFWQLDRLAQRRAYNTRVTAETTLPPLNLNQSLPALAAFGQMEYRPVVVTGQYDFSQEVLLSNQVYQGNRLGMHVLTPLKIQGSNKAILVDRGWIPAESSDLQMRARYQEPGTVTVKGLLRASQAPVSVLGITPSTSNGPHDIWNEVDLKGIQTQTSDSLLPLFIQESADPAWTGLPYRTPLDLQLSDGPHLSYAIQWFLFASILVIGYPLLIRRQLRPAKRQPGYPAPTTPAGRSNHNHA